MSKELKLFIHNGTAKTRRGNELAGLYFSTTFNRLDFKVGGNAYQLLQIKFN